MQRFMLMFLVAVLVMASMASAATVWDPANNPAPANRNLWEDPANWTAGVPVAVAPGEVKAQFYIADTNEAWVSDAQACLFFVQGDNGADDAGIIRIKDGGTLTTGNNWSAVGYNRIAHTIVEAGGALNFGQHMWIGLLEGAVGTLDISGTVTVAGQLGIGWNGGVGTVNVLDGGLLVLDHWSSTASIKAGSVLDIRGTGVVTIPGNQVSQALDYADIGRIIGNGVLGYVSATYDDIDDITTIAAIDYDPNSPFVDAGDDMIAWSGAGATLDPNIVEMAGSAWTNLTYLWTAEPNGIGDPNLDVDITNADQGIASVTITKAVPTGDVTVITLTLAVNNEGNLPEEAVKDTMTIDVYDNACLATKAAGQAVIDPTDVDGNCITNFKDFAVMATTWLDDYALTEPVVKLR